MLWSYPSLKPASGSSLKLPPLEAQQPLYLMHNQDRALGSSRVFSQFASPCLMSHSKYICLDKVQTQISGYSTFRFYKNHYHYRWSFQLPVAIQPACRVDRAALLNWDLLSCPARDSQSKGARERVAYVG